jgi:hypothetical protein
MSKTQYRVFLKERKEGDALVGQLDIKYDKGNAEGPGYYGYLHIRNGDAVAKMKRPGDTYTGMTPRFDYYGPFEDPQEIFDKVIENFGHALEVEDEPYLFGKS